MALFVYRGLAGFALVALLSKTPKELLTEGAERWLAEELGHELVAVDFVRPLMLDRTAPFGNVPGFGFLY